MKPEKLKSFEFQPPYGYFENLEAKTIAKIQAINAPKKKSIFQLNPYAVPSILTAIVLMVIGINRFQSTKDPLKRLNTVDSETITAYLESQNHLLDDQILANSVQNVDETSPVQHLTKAELNEIVTDPHLLNELSDEAY